MAAPLDVECLFRVLASHQVEYVLIGGLAAVLHGSPAMTNDADIVPAATPKNLEHLSAALRDLHARLRSADDPDGVPFDPHPQLIASMMMLNMTTRCGDLDMTFAPSGGGSYTDLVARCVDFEIAGTRVHVAALEDIIRSKESANRPKDRAVLPVLRALRDEIERLERSPTAQRPNDADRRISGPATARRGRRAPGSGSGRGSRT